MGVKGLEQYISSREELLTTYQLNASYVVIDGSSLAHVLCQLSATNNLEKDWHPAFGGDYDKYAYFVSEFFDQLHKCDVTPIVLMDGIAENKKMETQKVRRIQNLIRAFRCNPASRQNYWPHPLNINLIFQAILKENGIKMVQCVFEGDPCTAAVAKFLDCPVLARDSDYYVFGVKYIPLNSLGKLPYVAKKCHGRYVIQCRLFRFQNFLRLFPGLKDTTLPLVAVILGNDYLESEIFGAFKTVIKCHEHWRVTIHDIFKWLNNKSLYHAVGAILSTLSQNCRANVLKKIELVVNGYLNLSYEMLVPLGFTEQYKNAEKLFHQEIFKFNGNIENLELKEFWTEDQIEILKNFDREKDTKEIEIMRISNMLIDSDKAIDDMNNYFTSLPSWFVDDYTAAHFPAIFIDMIFHRRWVSMIQIEDYKYPSSEIVSLKIVRVIDALLLAGRKETKTNLIYEFREGMDYVNRYLYTNDVETGFFKEFPSLEKLRDTPMNTRRQILDDTLEISGKENLIEDIPAEWKLYVATIVYWLQQTIKPARNIDHMYAVLFTMLMGVIDRKINYHRSMKSLYLQHNIILNQIESTRQSDEPDVSSIKGVSLIDALNAVIKEDCLRAARFFISQYEMDQQFHRNYEKFNVTIVHAFSQFQSCIRYATSLNALLGYPYEKPIIAELFNGTMLYNLYTIFERQTDVEAYIAKTLKGSPSLLHLLQLLIAQVKRLVVFPDDSSDYWSKFGEYPEVQSEALRVMTVKGKTIYEEDIANNNNGRGVTKRKNKKKKKEESFGEYEIFADSYFRKKSTTNRQKKHRIRSVTDDSSSFDNFF